jgi:hypothetical protein
MHVAVRHQLQIYDPADASLCEAEAVVLPVREAQAVMGETVAAYLDRVAWRFELPTVCRINGAFVLRAQWATRALAVDDHVEFVSRPLGGGSSGPSVGKSILAVVALVALTAVAGPLGGAVAGTVAAAGSTAFAVVSALASAAIVGAGSLALSFFLSPKSGGKTAATDALYAFGFQGNAARPMQPIPVLNGRVRFAPDYAAPTYSEYDGDAMTDYALYALTCGRMRVEQVLIGDTPIWDHQAGPSPEYPGIELQIVEPGDPVTLYPVNVVTADELGGSELSTAFTPGYIVNAAGTSAKQLLLDFVWPGGAFVTYKDRTLAATTGIEIQARTVDDAGAPTSAWATVFAKAYTHTKQSQIRVTERVDVAPGRYEVRGRRTNPSVEESNLAKVNGTDAVTWTALRAHIAGPQSFPRVTTLAVKGVASKRLSGISGGQLRVIGTRILPVWRDGQFVDEPTRSIAWAALDWWRNGDYAAGLSLADVDVQAFIAYDALWASLGHSFDYRFTEVQNLDDVLETVLKAGRAFPAPVGDKLTLTRDQPRGLSRMLFTENDIVRDSLEIDYALSDEAWADGIVGEYVDQTTWRLAEVSSAPDGVTLSKPARVQLHGVVDRKQAAGMVRFLAAESQYRRITVSWIGRLEGRLLKRGDLVRISAEEPETWGQSCEIVGIDADGLGLRLDPAPVWEAGGSHYVEIRRRDGRPWGPVRVLRGSDDARAVVVGVDADAEASRQGLTLADAVARSDTQERPWLVFSPGQPRTFPVLITEGDPDQDGEHIHLTGVLDAPEVYTTTETGVPPLLQLPDLFSSALPAIVGLAAQISQRQLILLLTAGWQAARNAATYVADVSYDGGREWIRAYEGDRTTFEATVGAAAAMKVRVAGITPAGIRGAFYVVDVKAPNLTVDGALVDDFSVTLAKLSAETQAQIRAIDDLGRGLLALGSDSTEAALQLAKDTVRGGMRQLQEALDRFADAQATQAAAAFEQRQLIKIGTSASFAAIGREEVARFDADAALASVQTALAARLTLAEGDILANATAIQGLSASVTSIDGRVTAQSQSITALSARVDSAEANISGQASAIQGLTTRVTVTEGNVSTISQAVTALQATVSDHDGRIEANAQAAQTLTARADNVDGQLSAQASSLQALGTRVDGHSATLTTYGASIDGQKVQFGVTGNIDGATGGFVFTGVRRLDGAVSYSLNISADVFVDGTITARKLAAQQLIVNGQLFDLAATQTVPAASDDTFVDASIAVRSDSARVKVEAFFRGNSNVGSTRGPGDFLLYRDGNEILRVPASFALFRGGQNNENQYYLSSMAIATEEQPGAGNHTYRALHSNGQGVGGVRLFITEFSK